MTSEEQRRTSYFNKPAVYLDPNQKFESCGVIF